MAGTRGRSKAIIVTKQSVEQAGVFLQGLPEKPKENLSLREAVGQLRDQIQAALAKGYSYDDLSKMLTDKGIEISATTLKSYVPAGKRQSSKEKAATGKTRGKRTRKSQSDESGADLGSSTTQGLTSLAEALIASAAAEQSATEAPSKRGKRASSTATAAKGTRGKRAASSTTPARSGRGRQKRS